MRGQDLLTALADELRGIAPELAQAYDLGTQAAPGAAERANDSYITSVTRLSEAAGYMGLEGVKRICACVLANLEHLDADDRDARVLVRPFFTDWAQLLEAHLRNAQAPSPIVEPTRGARSIRITRQGAPPAIAGSLVASSAAASTPVRPPPTTSAVNRPGASGRCGSAARCAARRAAAS